MSNIYSRPQVYQFRLWLREISPAIWRRILVRDDSTIADFHNIIQIVMEWTDYHLHQFVIRGKEYGISRQYGPSFKDNPRTKRLADFQFLLRERFVYEYNFTDSWQLEIRLEKILPLDAQRIYPFCISGARASPAEDGGGSWAYMQQCHHHRLNPPLAQLSLMAQMLNRVLEAKENETIREVIGDVDELQDALEVVEAYRRFRPECFDRREVNSQLKLFATECEQWRQKQTQEH